MADLPQGVVTFLFTDVEGSTALWEEAPESMMEALRRHDTIIDDATAVHNGVPVKPRGEGDSRFVVFVSAIDAVSAAAEMQRGLAGVEWPTPRAIRVRISVHTGTGTADLPTCNWVTTTDLPSTGRRAFALLPTVAKPSCRGRRGSSFRTDCRPTSRFETWASIVSRT